MSNEATNDTVGGKQTQAHVVEVVSPSSLSPSDKLLRRIATLLSLLVAGMLTVFGYYASSICITVVLAAFLAILFDPVVVRLEKLRLPRGVAAAIVVLAGMGLIGLLCQELYGRAMSFAEELPAYTSKIQQTLEPIGRKIQKQESAGSLTTMVSLPRKFPRCGCGNRQPGLPIWSAVQDLCGEC